MRTTASRFPRLGHQNLHRDATRFPGLCPQPEVRRGGPSLVGWSRDTVGAGSLGARLPVGARQRGVAAPSGAGGAAACLAPRPRGCPLQVVGCGHVGLGRLAALDPPGPQSAAASPPATAQRCGKTSGRVLGGQAGGRHACGARGAGCREERGWWGGAGACALRPCHIGMSRSAERRRRRLRRSAGGGGRGELPAAPLRGAQQEEGR